MRRRGSRLINFGRVFRRRMAFDVSLKNRDAVRVDIHRVPWLAVKLDVRTLELLLERLCLVVNPLRFVRAGYGSKFSADRHAVSTVQFSYVISGHKIKKANKWMLATAGRCLFGLFGVQRPPRQILVVLAETPTHAPVASFAGWVSVPLAHDPALCECAELVGCFPLGHFGDVSKILRCARFRPVRSRESQNNSVESNGRDGVCRSFHVVRSWFVVAECRCPAVAPQRRSSEKSFAAVPQDSEHRCRSAMTGHQNSLTRFPSISPAFRVHPVIEACQRHYVGSNIAPRCSFLDDLPDCRRFINIMRHDSHSLQQEAEDRYSGCDQRGDSNVV